MLDGCATLWGFTLTHPRLRRISLLGCNGLKEVLTARFLTHIQHLDRAPHPVGR